MLLHFWHLKSSVDGSLVVHWGGRAGQMVDLVHLQQQLLYHNVPDQLKIVLANQVRNVLFAAREKIVHTDDLHSDAYFQQFMMLLDVKLAAGILNEKMR